VKRAYHNARRITPCKVLSLELKYAIFCATWQQFLIAQPVKQTAIRNSRRPQTYDTAKFSQLPLSVVSFYWSRDVASAHSADGRTFTVARPTFWDSLADELRTFSNNSNKK